MKKLMILIAMMGFVGTTAFGQYSSNRNTQARQGKVYTDNWNNHRTSERSKRGVTQSVNLKQREIRGLIADGIMDGSITGREAKELLEASERIELKENRFMRNGRLTNRESKELRENLEN